MDSADWSNGIRYHETDTRSYTEFKLQRDERGTLFIGRKEQLEKVAVAKARAAGAKSGRSPWHKLLLHKWMQPSYNRFRNNRSSSRWSNRSNRNNICNSSNRSSSNSM